MDTGLFLTGVEITDNQIPPVIGVAPSVLTATADSDSIVLGWTNNDTYTAITIFRKTTGDYSSLASAAGAATSYDDTTAVVGTTYTYQIRGIKGGYPTPYSNTASDTIPTVVLKAAQNAGVLGNWLSAVNPAGLRITKDDSYIIGGWIKWADSADAVILSKGDAYNSNAGSYDFNITGVSGIISFETENGVSTTGVDANDAIVSGTKSFVVGWVDATTINLVINAGTTASHPCVRTNVADSGTDFVLFSTADGAGGLGTKCILDEVFFCKNPPDMAAALSLIASTVYNSGSGNHYANLTAGNITTLGLVSWWGLDEASAASRLDLNSTNNLTLHGTITQVAPLTV